MIQRIQSVYLFLVFILSALFITGTLYQFTDPTGQTVVVMFTGAYLKNGNILQGRDMLIFALSVIIPVLAAASVFLFNNRRTQSWMVVSVIVLDIILISVLAVHLVHKGGIGFTAPVTSYRCLIPAINLLLLFLALRGIRKDEELVKSYDRIR
jgi:hypothetical protein